MEKINVNISGIRDVYILYNVGDRGSPCLNPLYRVVVCVEMRLLSLILTL